MLVERCPQELLLRWAAFGVLTPLMQAHGRFEQEAWRYDAETLRIYRALVLLHERLVPYIRAAAATAARSGLPIVRPLCLTDPEDQHGWTIDDAYGFGPALWVAPVLAQGARERRVYLPRGEWLDFWTGEPQTGGHDAIVAGPARSDPDLGPARCDRRHLPGGPRGRAGSGTRPSASARSRRRCGADPSAGARRPGWPTAPRSAGNPGTGSRRTGATWSSARSRDLPRSLPAPPPRAMCGRNW